jgi:hypothetical protein
VRAPTQAEDGRSSHEVGPTHNAQLRFRRALQSHIFEGTLGDSKAEPCITVISSDNLTVLCNGV